MLWVGKNDYHTHFAWCPFYRNSLSTNRREVVVMGFHHFMKEGLILVSQSLSGDGFLSFKEQTMVWDKSWDISKDIVDKVKATPTWTSLEPHKFLCLSLKLYGEVCSSDTIWDQKWSLWDRFWVLQGCREQAWHQWQPSSLESCEHSISDYQVCLHSIKPLFTQTCEGEF